jgi:hypothetical protein
MSLNAEVASFPQTPKPVSSQSDVKRICDEVGAAVDKGKIGDIVAKHEELILHYYKDVQAQAQKSFDTARATANFGFCVLIGTVAYVLLFDALRRFGYAAQDSGNSMNVGQIGIVSGIIIEFIAAGAFWLYSQGAKQFGAFHICLERTHRYLLAYKIAEQINDDKDDALHELLCIMANAPMITRGDINRGADAKISVSPEASSALWSTRASVPDVAVQNKPNKHNTNT